MDYKAMRGVSGLIKHMDECVGSPASSARERGAVEGIAAGVHDRIRAAAERVGARRREAPLVRAIDTYHKLSNFAGLDEGFVGAEIRTYIMDQAAYEVIYEYTVKGGERLRLFFVVPEFARRAEVIDSYISIALTWFEFVYPYACAKCARKLDVYIYLTPFRKTTPRRGEVIGKDHVNTAYTTSCVPEGVITIYRNEEWFKVLIHETFHVLGLDFSQHRDTGLAKEIREIFPISSEINLHEAYTETWAEILNCAFVSYYRTRTKRTFAERFRRCLRIEAYFSLFQMLKVLGHMGLAYTDLFARDSAAETRRLHFYREETNVFSYYVVTAMLLFNVDRFMIWCRDNNSNLLKYTYSPPTNRSFVALIRSTYRSRDFLDALGCLQRWDPSRRGVGMEEMRRTMRMSIIDLLEN